MLINHSTIFICFPYRVVWYYKYVNRDAGTQLRTSIFKRISNHFHLLRNLKRHNELKETRNNLNTHEVVSFAILHES